MPASPALLAHLADIVGDGHVLTDPALTGGYTTDWTGRWHGRTAAVVRPATARQVADVVRACAAVQVPIVAQGGNTGLVGGSVPHDGEIVLSLRRLDRVIEVDPLGRTLSAGAGVTVAAADRAAREHHLAFGVDLASRESATLGGIVATNAGGVRVVRHGATRSQVLGVEAVLADGSILRRWSGLEKDNVGYDVPGLLTGSEGTLAVITGVLAKLVVPAAHVQVLLLAVPSLAEALRALAHVRRSGFVVEAAEFFQHSGVELVCARSGLRPPFERPSPTYLLLEISDTSEDAAVDVLADLGDLVTDGALEPGPARRLWAYREGHTEAVSGASTTPPVKLDVAVPVRRLAAFESSLRAGLATAYPGVRVITFGHIAEGNVHVNLLDVDRDDAEKITDTVLHLVADHDGSISAEHGIGVGKLPWISLGRSQVDLTTMRAIKQALDPDGLLNPGVLLPPAPAFR